MSEHGSAPPPPPGSGGGSSSYGPPPPAPAPYGGGFEPPPDNNLVWGILTTLFCCLPAGIPSIVYAAQVNGKWQAGDREGAFESARKAKKWAIISVILFAVFVVLYIILIVIVGVAANMESAAPQPGY